MLFDDLKKANMMALKNKDQNARAVLGILISKCMLVSVELKAQGKELADNDVIAQIRKTLKELEEERLGFEKANRTEQVEALTAQINLIEGYLPPQLNEAKVREIISTLEDKKVPVVMKYFKENYNGLVDMGLVNKVLREFN